MYECIHKVAGEERCEEESCEDVGEEEDGALGVGPRLEEWVVRPWSTGCAYGMEAHP